MRRVVISAAMLTSMWVPAAAQTADTVDLNQVWTSRVLGTNDNDHLAYSVASGDINGDGYDDLIVGALRADPGGKSDAGEAYVIYGSASGIADTVDLSSPPASGVSWILGAGSGDSLGCSVSAGDVNGDGYDDVIVGAPGADPGGKSDAGEAYVIYGSASGIADTVDLSSPPASGVSWILGIYDHNQLGYSVSCGDLDNDGYKDVIVGAPNRNTDNGITGEAYVLYGSASGIADTVNLASPPASGVSWIMGDIPGENLGRSSFSADVNGDGNDDVILGGPYANSYAGVAYVIYSTSSGLPDTVDLASPPASGATWIFGAANNDQLGTSLSAGDINGDGNDDVIVGAPEANPPGGFLAGQAYVFYGSASGLPDTIQMSSPPSTGISWVLSKGDFCRLGSSVSAGDINSDGFDDVIVGAEAATPPGGSNAGEMYVLYGSASGIADTVNLASPPASGVFWLLGDNAGDNLGFSASSGDINRDGYDDVLAGAYQANNNSGQVCVVSPVVPAPVNLISPADSAFVDTPDVDFCWSSSNRGMSVRYSLVIDGTDTVDTGSDTTYTYTGLSEAWHSWFVIAENYVGSAVSDTWFIETGDTTAPEQVVLIAPADSSYLTTLSNLHQWSPVSFKGSKSPVRYIVQIDDNSDFSSPVITDTTDQDTGTYTVPAEGVYYWRVMAFDLAGNQGPWSSVWMFEVDNSAPAQVALISPADSAFVNSLSNLHQWSPVSFKGSKSPVRYIVQIDDNSDFSSPVITDTTDQDTGTYTVPAEGVYYWRVMAFDLAGNQGPWSDTWSFEVDTTPPAQITLVSPDSASQVQSFDVPFFWLSVSKSPVRYVIEVDTSSSFGSDLYQTDTVDISLDTLTVGLDHVWYYWRVMAFDLAGNQGPWSNVWSFYVNTTQVKENAVPKVFFLRACSNPSRTGAFVFGLPRDAGLSLRAYDASGRVVWNGDGRYRAGTYQRALNLKPGVYFIRMDAGSFRANEKLIIR